MQASWQCAAEETGAVVTLPDALVSYCCASLLNVQDPAHQHILHLSCNLAPCDCEVWVIEICRTGAPHCTAYMVQYMHVERHPGKAMLRAEQAKASGTTEGTRSLQNWLQHMFGAQGACHVSKKC